ncbi:hypothetical protein PQ462_10960 [Flavobacterium sp. KACC 22758]|uniref:hypothetical protein n=1 Tax=Flavobacterium sp. KACC 22758 TaxID=3025667 RepID=UPI00236722D3|nr:hypothetical protein [Flavobacterium sp. KACC 22758]WDF61885.1 hypothetical protein PQ462_10960 [Flavobacterium sp. KACC 22758]
MKKIFLTIIAVIITSSCNTYLDHGKKIHTDYMDFYYMDSYNEFIYKSKIKSTADKEIYYPTSFKVNLPKKIKNWQISSNEFYFEYDNKEIIYIYSGYKNEGSSGKWTLRETNDNEIYKRIDPYWNKRKYDEDALKNGYSGRTSKAYTDDKVIILLYNVKLENFENYLSLIKTFKYLD